MISDFSVNRLAYYSFCMNSLCSNFEQIFWSAIEDTKNTECESSDMFICLRFILSGSGINEGSGGPIIYGSGALNSFH